VGQVGPLQLVIQEGVLVVLQVIGAGMWTFDWCNTFTKGSSNGWKNYRTRGLHTVQMMHMITVSHKVALSSSVCESAV
jgi:hypothetical protein